MQNISSENHIKKQTAKKRIFPSFAEMLFY